MSFPLRNKYGVNSGGNQDVVPAKAGNQGHIKLDSCLHRKPWIPAYAGMTETDTRHGHVIFYGDSRTAFRSLSPTVFDASLD